MQPLKHYHARHKLVVSVLKDVANNVALPYPIVKAFFVSGDDEITIKFWELFYIQHPFRTHGVEYCKHCKKFLLEFHEPRVPWSLEKDIFYQ